MANNIHSFPGSSKTLPLAKLAGVYLESKVAGVSAFGAGHQNVGGGVDGGGKGDRPKAAPEADRAARRAGVDKHRRAVKGVLQADPVDGVRIGKLNREPHALGTRVGHAARADRQVAGGGR